MMMVWFNLLYLTESPKNLLPSDSSPTTVQFDPDQDIRFSSDRNDWKVQACIFSTD